MLELLRHRAGDRLVTVVATERSDGDVHPEHDPPGDLRARQRTATGAAWLMIDQVHGCDVVDRSVTTIDRDRAVIGVGDVLVGDGREPIAIWAADCAAIVLVSDDLIVGCHAGWRGLAAGVVDVAVTAAVTRSGDVPTAAVLGPCIHPCCYEFGAADLAAVAAGIGLDPATVTGATTTGALALDVPAAVAGALRAHDIELRAVGPCTGCDDRWYSHRRGDQERHAVVAWSEP